MKKEFYTYNALNRFRAYRKKNFDNTFEYGIQMKLNLLFFKYWLTIFKVNDYTKPQIKIGCIVYPFTKVVDILNKLY